MVGSPVRSMEHIVRALHDLYGRGLDWSRFSCICRCKCRTMAINDWQLILYYRIRCALRCAMYSILRTESVMSRLCQAPKLPLKIGLTGIDKKSKGISTNHCYPFAPPQGTRGTFDLAVDRSIFADISHPCSVSLFLGQCGGAGDITRRLC